MNRKCVEGLPLKYVIIAIIAALIAGVMINVSSTLGNSVNDSATAFAAKLANITSGSLGE